MKRNHKSNAFVLIIATVAVVGVPGCSVPKAADFKPSKLLFWNDDEPEKGIPIRMVGTWTDTVMSTAGQKSQRGFGGRIHFYGKKEDKPIVVDGQLVVYAFDETNRAVTDNKPTRRYVFPADQLPLRMSISEIGASYSFFLPWDEAGGPQTEVSLICRFEPKGGAVIASEQTKHVLPGTVTPTGTATAGKPPALPEGVPHRPAQPTLESIQQGRMLDHSVQQTSYSGPVASGEVAAGFASAQPLMPAERMTTTSIPLPQHYRMPVGPPAQPPAGPAIALPPAAARTPQQPLPAIPAPQPPAAASVPTNVPSDAAPSAMQPMSLGFGAYPSTQAITPTILMPTSYSPATRGFTAPPVQRTAPMQPSPAQVGRPSTPRAVQWNTAQTTYLPNAAGTPDQTFVATQSTVPSLSAQNVPAQQQQILAAAGATGSASLPPATTRR